MVWLTGLNMRIIRRCGQKVTRFNLTEIWGAAHHQAAFYTSLLYCWYTITLHPKITMVLRADCIFLHCTLESVCCSGSQVWQKGSTEWQPSYWSGGWGALRGPAGEEGLGAWGLKLESKVPLKAGNLWGQREVLMSWNLSQKCLLKAPWTCVCRRGGNGGILGLPQVDR